MSYKNEFINEILAVEGGYVNDPSDSGGETNFGITKRVARKYGYSGSMKEMPKFIARQIYEALYWDALCLTQIEGLSVSIAKELGDTGVNQGVGRAAEFLQRSLNVLNDQQKRYNDIVVDGDVGPKTIQALQKYLVQRGKEGETVLLNMLNCLQGAFYVTLAERREKDERFIFGWFKNRVTIT